MTDKRPEIAGMEIKQTGYTFERDKRGCYRIIRTKWKKHKPPPYVDVVFNIEPAIDIAKITTANENIECYGDRNNRLCAYMKTPFGTMEIRGTAIMIPRLPENETENIMKIQHFVMALLNGYKLSFREWLREDMKKFIEEDLGF